MLEHADGLARNRVSQIYRKVRFLSDKAIAFPPRPIISRSASSRQIVNLIGLKICVVQIVSGELSAVLKLLIDKVAE